MAIPSSLLIAIAAARVAHTNAESAIFAAAVTGQPVASMKPFVEELIDANDKLADELKELLKDI